MERIRTRDVHGNIQRKKPRLGNWNALPLLCGEFTNGVELSLVTCPVAGLE